MFIDRKPFLYLWRPAYRLLILLREFFVSGTRLDSATLMRRTDGMQWQLAELNRSILNLGIEFHEAQRRSAEAHRQSMETIRQSLEAYRQSVAVERRRSAEAHQQLLDAYRELVVEGQGRSAEAQRQLAAHMDHLVQSLLTDSQRTTLEELDRRLTPHIEDSRRTFSTQLTEIRSLQGTVLAAGNEASRQWAALERLLLCVMQEPAPPRFFNSCPCGSETQSREIS